MLFLCDNFGDCSFVFKTHFGDRGMNLVATTFWLIQVFHHDKVATSFRLQQEYFIFP